MIYLFLPLTNRGHYKSLRNSFASVGSITSNRRKYTMRIYVYRLSLIFAILALIPGFILLSETSWANTYAAASCSAEDVVSAISKASTGDTVIVPSGNCTWNNTVGISKAITLQGAGMDSTTITVGVSPAIILKAPAVVTGFTFQTSGKRVFTVIPDANSFRIHDNKFNLTGRAMVIYVGEVYGLIDNNSFNLTSGAVSSEVIFARGPTDSWMTPDSMGGAENLFVEDNKFILTGVQDTGATKAIDCNANSRVVFRYNNVTNMDFDAHGLWSNTPAHSVRHYEVYNNHFYVYPGDGTVTMWRMMSLRGGTGRVFDNTFTGKVRWAPDKYPGIRLIEYCDAQNSMPSGNCTNFVCPSDYPMIEQVGRGMNNSSDPLYLWNNTRNGVQIGAHLANWPSKAAIDYCGPFVASDIIKKNRDYYVSNSKPAALADYRPYTYPHPLRGESGSSRPMPPSHLEILNK